jgi:FixJ family two-component response regulator
VSGVPTVFIVDDDDAVRESIRDLVESANLPCECYASAGEFLARHADDPPGCVVTDVRMPGLGGLELQAALRERHSTIPVIMITGYGDVPTAVLAIKSGADEFLQKPVHGPTLIKHIQNAIRRNSEARRARAERERLAARFALLTARERDVLGFLAQGKSHRHIAAELQRSVKTIEVHASRIMKKLEVDNRTELVRLCFQAGVANAGK